MKIYFVTGNPNKAREFSEMINLPVEQYQPEGEIEEIQGVSEAIVANKGFEVVKEILEVKGDHSFCVIVEDSALAFHNWCNMPGPYIKGFEQNFKVAYGKDAYYKLADVYRGSGKHNGATASSIFGLLTFDMGEKDKVKFFRGDVNGELVYPRGENGFGWDCIFEYKNEKGEAKTFAEMTKEEKNLVSPRRIAIEKLRSYLIDLKSKY